MSAGVVDEEVAEGVTAEAGVRVKGPDVIMCCAVANWEWVKEGDGRGFLTAPLVPTGEAVAEGAMFCGRISGDAD